MTIEPRALIAAIHRAYRTSDPCHCHGDGNLNEQELLAALVGRNVLPMEVRTSAQ